MRSKRRTVAAAARAPSAANVSGSQRLLALTLGALMVSAPLMAQDINCPPGTRQKAPGVAQCVNTSTPDSHSEQNLVTWFVGIGAAIAVLALVLNRTSRGPSTTNPEFVARPETWPLPTNLDELFSRTEPTVAHSGRTRAVTEGVAPPRTGATPLRSDTEDGEPSRVDVDGHFLGFSGTRLSGRRQCRPTNTAVADLAERASTRGKNRHDAPDASRSTPRLPTIPTTRCATGR